MIRNTPESNTGLLLASPGREGFVQQRGKCPEHMLKIRIPLRALILTNIPKAKPLPLLSILSTRVNCNDRMYETENQYYRKNAMDLMPVWNLLPQCCYCGLPENRMARLSLVLSAVYRCV